VILLALHVLWGTSDAPRRPPRVIVERRVS
jgi:hypothetical protein